MPEEGINYVKRDALLSYEEMLRLMTILAQNGIEKIRITGGEPFLRKGMFEFLERLSAVDGLKQMHITTNGTLTKGKVGLLKEMGINSMNLSLDSLDKQRFFDITRRDEFEKVMDTLDEMLEVGMQTKINCVVMEGQNIADILPMVELAKDKPVSVRFIEEMPFNGTGDHPENLKWTSANTKEYIQQTYPGLQKIVDEKNSTSSNYTIPGFKGSVGFIAAYSRLFCGSCNRIRITPQGMMKTCLYDDGVFNVRDIMRNGASDQEVLLAIQSAIGSRAKDGFEAEKNRNNKFISESMATIGG